ncbi:hypothetical protein Bca4012_026664 [Brassica carinata]
MRCHKGHEDNPRNSYDTALQFVEFIFELKHGEAMPELLSKFITLLDKEKEEWRGVKAMIECWQEFRRWKKKSQTPNDNNATCKDFERCLFSPDLNVIVIQGDEGTITSKGVIQGVVDPPANRETWKVKNILEKQDHYTDHKIRHRKS